MIISLKNTIDTFLLFTHILNALNIQKKKIITKIMGEKLHFYLVQSNNIKALR